MLDAADRSVLAVIVSRCRRLMVDEGSIVDDSLLCTVFLQFCKVPWCWLFRIHSLMLLAYAGISVGLLHAGCIDISGPLLPLSRFLRCENSLWKLLCNFLMYGVQLKTYCDMTCNFCERISLFLYHNRNDYKTLSRLWEHSVHVSFYLCLLIHHAKYMWWLNIIRIEIIKH